MNKFYILPLILLLATTAVAQQGNISVKGKITDETTGVAMPGVNVVEKGTTNGVASDSQGNYVISVNSNATLIISFIGYEPVTIPVGDRSVVDVKMKEVAAALNEVVVVGYGTMEKKDLTGSIASINNKDFANQPTTNIAGNLQGKLAGVNITQTSGTPGASLSVSVRGASNPLYVVDGIPMLSESNSSIQTSTDTQGNVQGSGQQISTISDINPNDIESIEVLKDASAAAIYGARASNGVVLITTKRGKTGKTKFNVNYYTGVQTPTREIKFLNGQQFMDLINDAIAQDNQRYAANPGVFGPGFTYAGSGLDVPFNFGDANARKVNTNWLNQVLQNAPVTNAEVSATGGNDKTKFYVASTYFDQTGIVIQSAYKRFSTRVNLDHQATDKLSFGLTFNASYSKNHRSFNDDSYTGVITNALGCDPLMPVYDQFGNYANYQNYHTSWLSDNPVKSAKEIKAYTTSYRLLGSLFAEYKFSSALKFRTSWSADYNDLIDNNYFSPITANAQAQGGIAQASIFQQVTLLNENILTYNKTIGNSKINALAGYTVQQTSSTTSGLNGQGFPAGGLQNISSAAIITKGISTGTGFGLVSYIGRINYEYKGKYLLAVTSRLDGSSRFPKNNQYALFPSISGGWRISNEEFFGTNTTLTNLKLRASYGLTGDQEIGNFQNVALYKPTKYNNMGGLAPAQLVDPRLRWQTNKTFDVGMDWELFDGRISGTIDYFKSDKTNVLSNNSVAGSTGFSTVVQNAGQIENKGWEFSVSSTNIQNEKLKWTSNFNISFIQNKIISLTNDGLLVSAYLDNAPTNILQKGQSVGTFWAVKYLGVNPTNGDELFLSKTGATAGQAVNAQGVTMQDAQLSGSPIPKFFGGFNNNFNFGKFDVLIATQFSWGNKIYNLIKQTYLNMGWSNGGGSSQIYANNSTAVLKRWRQPGDITDVGRASFINQNYYNNSTQFIEDGSFWRIRTLAVGYTIRPKNIQAFERIRVYAQVQNLFVWTKYTGFDPEVSSTGSSNPYTAGIDYAAYPQPRTYTIGFNVTF
ncbi:MAG: TonB-dependent receptor [Bacteroidetes bacterium]|nr:TonB-dependent receptor [Bacteroidota bacterium]MBS1540292.1 TonB-dependent receptor [Bacteroidota bacterium]